MIVFRFILIASYFILTGAETTVDRDEAIFDVMTKCNFLGSFLDDGRDNILDFTIKFPILVPTLSEAQASFKAVIGDLQSERFWGRWNEGEEDFVLNGNSFKIVDSGGVTYYMSQFLYDSVNHCEKYSFSLETDDFPEGVSLMGDSLNVLHESSGGFMDFYGFFNCRFDGETPGLNQTEYCHKVRDVWNHTNLDVTVCLLEHYNDGHHMHCKDDPHDHEGHSDD